MTEACPVIPLTSVVNRHQTGLRSEGPILLNVQLNIWTFGLMMEDLPCCSAIETSGDSVRNHFYFPQHFTSANLDTDRGSIAH